jgi:predicted nuclease of predicted toxin-antitoxin system
VRLFADTNITAPAVRALRAAGHDVIYAAERASDPGDAALLAEAHVAARVFISKDHDFGAVVFRDGVEHSGVLLIDDLGNSSAEAVMLVEVLAAHGARLIGGAFLRAGPGWVRAAD